MSNLEPYADRERGHAIHHLRCGSASTSGSAEHPDWSAKISLAQMPNENNPAADTKTKEFAEALSKDLGIKVEGFDGR